MLQWIWAGFLLAVALTFVAVDYRRLDDDPHHGGVGFLVAAIAAIFAVGCVQDWVFWPPLSWLDGHVPQRGTTLQVLTIGAILLIALVAYLFALFGTAVGLATLTRSSAGLDSKAPSA
ncbi:hypothetical protein [Rhodanobacter thiooxydans]|uniref:hypothetical protein n=1 Tax=Rhodanobacter thiooxydans TaxID=416169 RepID=UPI001F29B373|nr:hypothetical protein [Rhodanobacter thiooxydans]UJJ56698.1 hypothetical protein LRK53_18995 [Rhodanobacter thiooxydans]